MNEHILENRRILISLTIILLLISFFIVYKLYISEKWQSSEIQSLEQEISDLSDNMRSLTNEVAELTEKVNQKKINWKEDEFNYLAIGNSITLHEICDYWWTECGMAATIAENDYFHIVSKNIGGHAEAVNYYYWEVMSEDRNETFSILENYLSSKIDLITIQLGENVSDIRTFEKDFKGLIKYIKIECPNAQIIVIGDFWKFSGRTEIKSKVAAEENVEYAGFEEIIGLVDYMCGIGTVVYDEMGNAHVIEHEGVAAHPNDTAMRYIAAEIISLVEK